jgi:hypothetical protein
MDFHIVLRWLILYLFCPSIVKNVAIVTPEPFNRNGSRRFGAVKSDSTYHFFGNACIKVRAIAVFPVFRLLTDFVCLLTYEFCLSLWKIARCSVILLLPLFDFCNLSSSGDVVYKECWWHWHNCHKLVTDLFYDFVSI